MDELHPILRGYLRQVLAADPSVIAAWEGGAHTTGFVDEYSDLDLLVVNNAVTRQVSLTR